MTEVIRLLERRAEWQKSRKTLSWPEKIRMAERVRASAARLRSRTGKSTVGSHKPRDF